jgi:hypothetical protein
MQNLSNNEGAPTINCFILITEWTYEVPVVIENISFSSDERNTKH